MVSPFMDPGMGDPMMQQQAPPQAAPMGDPRQLLAMLEQTLGPVQQPKPRYRAGYSPPKKPDITALWGQSTTIKSRHQRLLDRFETDRLWLQLALVGMFQEDVLKKDKGLLVDEFQSTGIAADWNMVCAYLAALPFEPSKTMLRDDLRVEARMVQDAARYLRDEEVMRYNDAWGADLAMEEARFLTIYGRIVNRTVVNLSDPDFPFDSTLIDPSTVFFKDDGRQITEAYHRSQTTYRQLVGTFGEPPAATMRKIKNDHGSTEWLDTEVDALDYWDTWYRAVVTQDATFVPVTAHEYGTTPFTIQFGPLGMPVAGSPGRSSWQVGPNGQMVAESNTVANDLANKGLSYIHYMRREHEQYEAIMARITTGFKKGIDPPLLRERDMFAGEKPMERLDTGPGQQNETMLGNEKVSPIPTSASPIDTNIMLTAMTQEQRGTRLPPMFGGFNEQSNVSGTAQNGLADAGMEKVNGWLRSAERYHSVRFTRWFEMWRNFGHLAAYGGEERRPLLIPRSSPRKGEQPAFELTRDLIDRVGPRIQINMSKPRQNQLLPIVNAYQGMVTNGWATDAMAMEALGFTDVDRIRAEWMEDKALKQALDHPKFVESFTIPMALMEALKEAEGDPQQQQGFMAALGWWMQNIVQPAQMQMQQQMTQMQQPPQAPPMQGQPPSIQGGSAGMSLPDATGQAPGSITGQQGGPPPNMLPPGQLPPQGIGA